MSPWLPRVLPRTVPRHSTNSLLHLGRRTHPIYYRCSLCHTASRAQHPSPPPAHNTPNYVPLLREIEQRRDEARRSILVQVRIRSTAPKWVPIWGPGSPWGPFSVFGSPKGPHFLSRSPFSLFQAEERVKSRSIHYYPCHLHIKG